MRAVLEIPDEFAKQLERHAKQSGQATADYMLKLLRVAMLIDELPFADVARSERTLQELVEARNRLVHQQGPAELKTDPDTGLRVIISPPDAAIHKMSVADVLALEQSILEGEDLKRAGLPL